MQVRTSFQTGAVRVDPWLNVTAQHDFMSKNRWIVSTETAAMDMPIWTSAATGETGVYGKVAGGVVLGINKNLSLFMNGRTTFSRDNGDLHGVVGGALYQF